jgi:O-antigen ligase
VIYYFLLVTVVNTQKRLQIFAYSLNAIIFLVAGLALLQYHGFINNAALSSISEMQWEDVDVDAGIEATQLVRLCAAGIFANPNDLSRILVVGIMISLYGLGECRTPLTRLVWLVPFGVFNYALILTHSRGGFLTLLTSLMALLIVRFGGRKTIIMSIILLPLLFVVFGGRQTHLNTSKGTGHHRIEVWNNGFELWRASPMLGIGMDNYAGELGIVAHNTFVHEYTELGLIGGTLFLGAFYLAVYLPYRAGQQGTGFLESHMYRFRPVVIGIVAGYMMGMLSSSRNTMVPTYLLVGLAAAFVQLADPYFPYTLTRLNGRLARQVIVASVICVVGHYLFIRISLAQG